MILAFTDTETPHLIARGRVPWEIAIIRRRPNGTETEHVWQVRPDLATADPEEPAERGLSSFDFHGHRAAIYTDDRGHWVFPKQLCTFMGIDGENQRKRINRNHWSATWTATMAVQVPGDTQVREHFLLHQRRLPMWLGSITTSSIKDPEVRAEVEQHQTEFADALADYLTKGGAINPRATTQQVDALHRELDVIERAHAARARLEAMGVAKQFGLVNDSYVEAMARTELARMNGEEPDIDPADITITCDEYLTGRGVSGSDLGSARTRLGKTVAVLYRARHRRDPQKIERPIHGVHRKVAVYTHRDIDLFDKAWSELARHYDLQTSVEGD